MAWPRQCRISVGANSESVTIDVLFMMLGPQATWVFAIANRLEFD
jgi:hypothetical protein